MDIREKVAEILFIHEEWGEPFAEWKEDKSNYFHLESLLKMGDQILATLKEHGYVSLDDVAEGWTHCICDFPRDLPITGEHCPAEEYKERKLNMKMPEKWGWDSCEHCPCQYFKSRPATHREVRAGKAVRS